MTFWVLLALVFAAFGGKLPIFSLLIISFMISTFASIRTVLRHGLVSAPSIYIFLYIGFHLSLVFAVYLFRLPMPLKETFVLGADLLSEAIVLVVFGLIAFQIGIELAPSTKPFLFDQTKNVSEARKRSIFRLALLMLALLSAAYLFFGLNSRLLIEGKELLVEMRREESKAALPFGLAYQLLIMVSFIALAFSPRKYFLWVAAIPIVLRLPMFLSGKRGDFIVMLAAIIVVAAKRGFKIPLAYVASGVTVLAWLSSYLRALKHSGDFAAEWYLNILYEMGRQLRVVIFTLHALRDNITDYWLGSSYLYGIWYIIPDIGGIRNLFGEADPAIWLSRLYTGGNYVGIGFSSVAEPYLNFGWPGVLVIMALLGFLLARLESVSMESPFVLSIYGACLGKLFFAIRGDLSGLFRFFIWTWLILRVLQFIVTSVARTRTIAGRRKTSINT